MVTVPSVPDREEAKKGNTLSVRPEVSRAFMGPHINNWVVGQFEFSNIPAGNFHSGFIPHTLN